MNKTKLEIIRINEDVIATSTLNGEYVWCCYKFSDNHLDVNDSFYYYYKGIQNPEGTDNLTGDNVVAFNSYFSNSGVTLQAGVWYAEYTDLVSGKSYFYPCDGTDHPDHSHN